MNLVEKSLYKWFIIIIIIIIIISPKCASEDSVHNRDKLPSFSSKHFEDFPNDVKTFRHKQKNNRLRPGLVILLKPLFTVAL